jgi:hypothetical protein
MRVSRNSSVPKAHSIPYNHQEEKKEEKRTQLNGAYLIPNPLPSMA